MTGSSRKQRAGAAGAAIVAAVLLVAAAGISWPATSAVGAAEPRLQARRQAQTTAEPPLQPVNVSASPPSFPGSPTSPPPPAPLLGSITCEAVWTPNATASAQAAGAGPLWPVQPLPTSPPLRQALGPFGSGATEACLASPEIAASPGWDRSVDLRAGIRRYDLALTCTCSGQAALEPGGCWALAQRLDYTWWDGPPWSENSFRQSMSFNASECSGTVCTASRGDLLPTYASLTCIDDGSSQRGALLEAMFFTPLDVDTGSYNCTLVSYQLYDNSSAVYGGGSTAAIEVQAVGGQQGPPCARQQDLPQASYNNWANVTVLTCTCAGVPPTPPPSLTGFISPSPDPPPSFPGNASSPSPPASSPPSSNSSFNSSGSGSCYRLAFAAYAMLQLVPSTASVPSTESPPTYLDMFPSDCTAGLCITSTRLNGGITNTSLYRGRPLVFAQALCANASSTPELGPFPAAPAGILQCAATWLEQPGPQPAPSPGQSPSPPAAPRFYTATFPPWAPANAEPGTCWLQADMAQADPALGLPAFVRDVSTEAFGAQLLFTCTCTASPSNDSCYMLARHASLSAWEGPLWASAAGGPPSAMLPAGMPLSFSPSDCTATGCRLGPIAVQHAPYAQAMCAGAWPYQPSLSDVTSVPNATSSVLPYCVLDLYELYDNSSQYYPPAAGDMQPLSTPDLRPPAIGGVVLPPPPANLARRRSAQASSNSTTTVPLPPNGASTAATAGPACWTSPQLMYNNPSPPPGAAASNGPIGRRSSLAGALAAFAASVATKPSNRTAVATRPALPDCAPAGPASAEGNWGRYARFECACASASASTATDVAAGSQGVAAGNCYRDARLVAWFYSLQPIGQLPQAGSVASALSFQPWQCTLGSCVTSTFIDPGPSPAPTPAPVLSPPPPTAFRRMLLQSAGTASPVPSPSAASSVPLLFSEALCFRTPTFLTPDVVAASVGATVATTVATVTATAIASSAAVAVGGAGAGAGMASTVAANTAGRMVPLLSMLQHMQFLSLTGDSAALLGETYADIAVYLSWTNYRYDITGLSAKADEPTAPLSPAGSPAGATSRRRSLQSGSSVGPGAPQGARRRLAQVDVELPSLGFSGTTPAEAHAYNTLVVVAVLLVGSVLLHALVLWAWGRSAALRRVALPELFVYPSVELKLLDATITSVGGAAGTLVAVAAATNHAAAIAVACVSCVWVAAVVGITVFIVMALLKRLAWYRDWKQRRDRERHVRTRATDTSRQGANGGTAGDCTGPVGPVYDTGLPGIPGPDGVTPSSPPGVPPHVGGDAPPTRASRKAPYLPLEYRRAAPSKTGPSSGPSARSLPPASQGSESTGAGTGAGSGKGEGEGEPKGGAEGAKKGWRVKRALEWLERGEWATVELEGREHVALEPQRTQIYLKQGLGWRALMGPFIGWEPIVIEDQPQGAPPPGAPPLSQKAAPFAQPPVPAGPSMGRARVSPGPTGHLSPPAGEPLRLEEVALSLSTEDELIPAGPSVAVSSPRQAAAQDPTAAAATAAAAPPPPPAAPLPPPPAPPAAPLDSAPSVGAPSLYGMTPSIAASLYGPPTSVGASLYGASPSVGASLYGPPASVGPPAPESAVLPPSNSIAAAPSLSTRLSTRLSALFSRRQSQSQAQTNATEPAAFAQAPGGEGLGAPAASIGRPGGGTDAGKGPAGKGDKPAGEGTHVAPLHPSKEEMVKMLTTVQLYERYGELMRPYKGTSLAAATFQVPLVICTAVSAFLLGLQAGDDVDPGTWAAVASTAVLLAIKGAFLIHLAIVRPHVNILERWVEAACGALETGAVACMLALQHNQYTAAQRGILVMEMVVLVLQVLAVWVLTVIPGVLAAWSALRHMARRKREAAAALQKQAEAGGPAGGVPPGNHNQFAALPAPPPQPDASQQHALSTPPAPPSPGLLNQDFDPAVHSWFQHSMAAAAAAAALSADSGLGQTSSVPSPAGFPGSVNAARGSMPLPGGPVPPPLPPPPPQPTLTETCPSMPHSLASRMSALTAASEAGASGRGLAAVDEAEAGAEAGDRKEEAAALAMVVAQGVPAGASAGPAPGLRSGSGAGAAV
ncbi:hypothetical protein HYH03_007469 [Edaphochlamys debaryana]|uniref:Ig-like domain-containing protein n=1 Tax=Edaphochlamys debaryana TaxID=47281 RepID=A0A835Y0J7_9CHLO|nr:hypothetical protein HYH03_007469 [Edaphochlamys debaryana]|eukprot:KAG2494417.1 hypothetical protein HYH03_007469 [Edaphochlamys debaryana]